MTGGGEGGAIVAVDVPDGEAAASLIARLGTEARWLKIGLELFCGEGPDIVRRLASAGHRVMLDLKLHDIPQTVARAARQAGRLGAELLTVHAAGGRAMLEAAAEASAESRLRVLAVTVLTSMDEADLAETGCPGPAEELVARRARLAAAAGCHGVVASPREAARVRAQAPAGFLIVAPGVRPAGAAAGDQKRVTTPGEARRAGADYIVVGRPVTEAEDPAAALRGIEDEFQGAR